MPEVSKAVLITGCSSGIGHATALRLASRGWPVYASARRSESIADLAEAGATTLQLDVTDEQSMRAAVAQVEREHGAVGVLINNAGYSQSGPIEQVAPDAIRRQFDTNVFGPVALIKLVLGGMRAQHWGKIVNVSSMGGRLTFPGGGYYHASKYALEAISDALRFEVRGFGVDVIVIEPGLIVTEFGKAAVASMDGAGDGGSVRRVQCQAGCADGRRLRGSDAPPRRRPGCRGEGDRAGDLTTAAARARARDPVGAPGDPYPPADTRSRLGRVYARAVPAAALSGARADSDRRQG